MNDRLLSVILLNQETKREAILPRRISDNEQLSDEDYFELRPAIITSQSAGSGGGVYMAVYFEFCVISLRYIELKCDSSEQIELKLYHFDENLNSDFPISFDGSSKTWMLNKTSIAGLTPVFTTGRRKIIHVHHLKGVQRFDLGFGGNGTVSGRYLIIGMLLARQEWQLMTKLQNLPVSII